MCPLCNGRKSVHQDARIGTMFCACPNCRAESGDLTDVIKHLEALIAKMKTRVKQGA
ncbi:MULTISPECIES: hypothetical protein [Bacillus]|uniref:Uncharacterized protein n=1 Tax=Bacillus paralicheniformis TaxID=1648923 RepID=A0A7Z0X0V2_9BACI|nr:MULTISPECIES: hypothetical protein [Bacillus]ETB71018.1 hypothetical protein A943_13325 [Bacillus sp. CPSM8]KUL18518.1 hypothetical protein LI6934_05805 [Bacillus licheniformis LMG 6934]MBC8622207.1 hypothetical protein [Robertmurraya crescens]AJO17659.1 hypothetical protein SC10_B2orf02174 [Bacillus paralicheniformis]KFM89292.1 hypothetical protein DJ88_1269 [Bacillus paralicheniformis]